MMTCETLKWLDDVWGKSAVYMCWPGGAFECIFIIMFYVAFSDEVRLGIKGMVLGGLVLSYGDYGVMVCGRKGGY